MIKQGYSLYACFANGTWFLKQARSERHFVQLCCAEEERRGCHVQPRFRHLYRPDFVYNERERTWYSGGSPYGPRLPGGN